MKNLFKFLLLGAFTLSLGVGFVGCKNYDSDIDGICKRLDVLEGDVAKLKDDVAKWVQDGNHYVTEATLGGAPNYTLTLKRNDGQSIVVDLKALSEVPAATPPGATPDPVEVHYPVLTGDETKGWEIKVWDTSKEPDDYTTIKVPGAGSIFNKIDVLGWVSAKAGTAGNYVGNTDAWSGDVTAALSAAEIVNDATYPLNVNYSYIDSFYTGDVDYTENTTGSQPATKVDTWTKGNETVIKGSVLNTLEADKAGFIVQVFPSTADITGTRFTMETSDGAILPVAFGTPKKISGLLTTRATSGSALWFVPGANTEEIFTAAATAPYAADYIKRFKTKARWALVAGGEVVSEYTDFSMTSIPYTSKEGPVASVQGIATGETAITKAAYTPAVSIGSTSLSVAYTVQVGKTYKVNFGTVGLNNTAPSGFPDNADTPAATSTPGVTDATIDYTLKTYGTITDDLFEVVYSNNNTEFTVNALTDKITLAPFVLEVTKLGVDGKIYAERIVILPERVVPNTLIPLNDYLIVDATPAVTDDNLGNTLVVPLTKMFEELHGYNFSPTVTMDRAWADEVNGAKTFSLEKMVIKGAGPGGADLTFTETTPASPANATGADWLDAMGTEGGRHGTSKSTGIGANTAVDGTGGAGDGNPLVVSNLAGASTLFKAKSIVIDKMPYAVIEDAFTGVMPGYVAANDGSDDYDPAWILGKEYQVTMAFKNAAGAVINTITYTFTPKMPELAALFTPDPAYWTPTPWVSTSVLNAYYQDPASYSATIDPDEFIYDAKPNVKGSGFKAYTAGVTWGILKPADAVGPPAFTQSDYVTYTQAAVTPTTAAGDMVFKLLEQVVDNANETADGVDYNGDGATTTADVDGVSVDLLPAASTVKPAFNLYKTELTVAPDTDYSYLAVYALTPAQREAMGYKMRIMSAMYEGDIKVLSTGGITLQPVGTAQKIDGTMIGGVKYNKVEPYDLFPVATVASVAGTAHPAASAAYAWTYIAKVEYLVHKDYVNNYSIADADGVKITGRAMTISDFFSKANAVTAGDKGFINIIANTTTNEVNAKLTVRVSDRFGKVKEQDIDFTIAKPTSKR